jgi:hypothetical protein
MLLGPTLVDRFARDRNLGRKREIIDPKTGKPKTVTPNPANTSSRNLEASLNDPVLQSQIQGLQRQISRFDAQDAARSARGASGQRTRRLSASQQAQRDDARARLAQLTEARDRVAKALPVKRAREERAAAKKASTAKKANPTKKAAPRGTISRQANT